MKDSSFLHPQHHHHVQHYVHTYYHEEEEDEGEGRLPVVLSLLSLQSLSSLQNGTSFTSTQSATWSLGENTLSSHIQSRQCTTGLK